jgi:nitric oxide reductase subunit B
MTDFFFWATWVCVTERPGSKVSYTNNWPPDTMVGNVPSPSLLAWSIISVVVLLAGIGALAWHYAAEKSCETGHSVVPQLDPLLNLRPTPSMRACVKYFWTVVALILAQIGMGIVTAHYGVEGNGLYGIPIQNWLPYSLTRTWHTQLGILWIATAWLATGLFVAPAVSGYEPKGQKLLVNVLYVCVVVIVVGSMIGQWFGVMQKLGYRANFWFGHQGLEYVDMGRFFQWFLFAGLFIWLGLMARALWPALRRPDEARPLLFLFVVSSAAIAMFWGAGLMWDRQTNLTITEYWRWWVVHLWVEGFFEVFATVVIAFLFTRMGLLNPKSATAAVLFSCTIFLFGGILGTFHHLYFTGTPTAVVALGATFSALEIVPLALIGFEAYENLKFTRESDWISAYKWPIYFFVAVAFWNLVGAGIFGFLINPPIALYYIQGLNTTPVHSHTALFGVYGFLGMGLMLFCLRALNVRAHWREGSLWVAFWGLNVGLALMAFISLLPVGLMQAWASLNHGMWYARSADFLQTPLMQNLRWMRVFGDVIFAIGAVAFAWFVVGLNFGWSMEKHSEPLIDPAGGIDEGTVVGK